MGVEDLSRSNCLRILDHLFTHGVTSRADLGRCLGLGPATVNRLTTRLVESGLVIGTGEMAVTGGRPSMMLDFNARHQLLLVADVADHHTDLALADLRGNFLRRWTFPTSGDGEHRYREFFATVDRVLADVGEDAERVASIGVSVPAPVDDDGVLLFGPALEWYDLPIRADLEEHCGRPVAVENDANLIALAEHHCGRWGATRSLVAIAVFDGVGSGIIEDGRLWRGRNGVAGQIGRMLVAPGSLSAHFLGRFGDFESHVGAPSFVRRAEEAGVPAEHRGSADAVMAAMAEGDRAARALVEEVLDEFAVSLVNVCALLAPDVIVFAGLFERWAEVLLPGLRARLEGHVAHLPRLAPVALGQSGALAGAARIAFERIGSLEGLWCEDPVSDAAGASATGRRS